MNAFRSESAPKNAFEKVFGIRREKVLKTCERHGEQEFEVYSTKNIRGFPRCPLCAAEERARDEKYAADFSQKNYWESCGIEKEFFGADFDSFFPQTKSQATALLAVKKLCSGELKKVVLLGENGTGKTMLGCIAVKKLGGKIISAFEIGLLVRESYSRNAEKSEAEILRELASERFLVIDEIGRHANTEAFRNQIGYVINKRHSRRLPLMVLSNAHLKKDCADSGCDCCFENFFGSDAVSRLQDAAIVSLDGAGDWRARKS